MIFLSLILWPIAMIVMVMRLPWPTALAVSVVGGYLLLPEAGMWFDPPLLPPFDKALIPVALAFALSLALRPGEAAPGRAGPGTLSEPFALPGLLPRNPWALLGIGMVVLGMLATAMTNTDTLRFAQTEYTRPGMTPIDGIAQALEALPMVLAIVLGRKYLAHPDHHKTLLWVIAVSGALYALPALYEIRMSPRLNVQIYGFFPHNWQQHIRSGGYRPIVFLEHGLFLALFFANVLIALFGLSRIAPERRGRLIGLGIVVFVTLGLSNSLGGLLVALLLAPVALLAGTRLQLLAAALIGVAILIYPAMRTADLVPTERLVAAAERVNPARAASLNHRFENEDLVLDHVAERPVFGWGGSGRNRVYDEFGRGVDTVDSAWIVALGKGGWVQFLGMFGLLAGPLVLGWRAAARARISEPTAVLSLMIAATMIDLAANSGVTPVSWLIVGALFGRVELGLLPERTMSRTVQADVEPGRIMTGTEQPGEPVTPYTRQTLRHVRRSAKEIT